MRFWLPSCDRVGVSSLCCFFFNDTATTEIYTLSLHDALPIYYGVILLAQILRDKGHQVTIYNNRTLKGKLEKITRESDAVCFSFFTSGANIAYGISNEIKKLSPDMPIIMGGIHPTSLPEEALKHSDFVIRGEGEIALPKLSSYLENGSENLENISNLSYKSEGKVKTNPSAEMIEDKKILQISPARDLDPNRNSWNRTPVLTPGRGCQIGRAHV